MDLSDLGYEIYQRIDKEAAEEHAKGEGGPMRLNTYQSHCQGDLTRRFEALVSILEEKSDG